MPDLNYFYNVLLLLYHTSMVVYQGVCYFHLMKFVCNNCKAPRYAEETASATQVGSWDNEYWNSTLSQPWALGNYRTHEGYLPTEY